MKKFRMVGRRAAKTVASKESIAENDALLSFNIR